mgnify:CR=1 FL=1
MNKAVDKRQKQLEESSQDWVQIVEVQLEVCVHLCDRHGGVKRGVKLFAIKPCYRLNQRDNASTQSNCTATVLHRA